MSALCPNGDPFLALVIGITLGQISVGLAWALKSYLWSRFQ